jgi:hypothetical protein
MESLGFYVCVADLEDELIRSLGTASVEQVIDAQGELGSFRTLQKQPAQQGRTDEDQLRRFMSTRGGGRSTTHGCSSTRWTSRECLGHSSVYWHISEPVEQRLPLDSEQDRSAAWSRRSGTRRSLSAPIPIGTEARRPALDDGPLGRGHRRPSAPGSAIATHVTLRGRSEGTGYRLGVPRSMAMAGCRSSGSLAAGGARDR